MQSSPQDVCWPGIRYLDLEPELIQLHLTCWDSSRVWSQEARRTGRLSYQSRRELPLGLSLQKSPPPRLDDGQGEELDTSSQTCQLSAHRSPAVDKHMRTSANTHRSPLQTEGVLRVMLLNFSPSFPTLVLPLSWQKLLAPLPPAITLSQSLSTLSFQLPRVFFSLSFHLLLFSLLTSQTLFFFLTPESFDYISIFFILFSHLPSLLSSSHITRRLPVLTQGFISQVWTDPTNPTPPPPSLHLSLSATSALSTLH